MIKRLDIGPAGDIIPGYERLDIRDLPGIDIVADARSIPVDDETYDEIRAYNLLEHFYIYETVDVLKEWHRILKIGGALDLLVPSILGIFQGYLAGKNTGKELIERLYGTQEYPENCHLTGFTSELLSGYLLEAGFSEVYLSCENSDGIKYWAIK